MAEKCPVLAKSSDLTFEYSCCVCTENDLNIEAQFNCEQCSKRYCGNCIALHNLLYKKHSVTGREKMEKWNRRTLEQCEEHPTETFTVFCEDHSKMLCQKCHVYSHQQCKEVTFLADKVQDLHQKGVFKTITETIQTHLEQLNQKIKDMKEYGDSLGETYTNTIADIETVHRNIRTALDKLRTKTVKELQVLNAILKTSLHSEIDKTTKIQEKTKYLQDNMEMLGNKSKALAYIMYVQCLDQSKETAALLANITSTTNLKIEFTHYKNIEQFLTKQTALGLLKKTFAQTKLNPTLEIRSETKNMEKTRKKDYVVYNVKASSDSLTCWITGICETPDGNLLISDWFNQNVKLLDHNYEVVNHLDLPSGPLSICSTGVNNIAVAADNYFSIYDIHFIRVTNGQLVQDRTLKPQHSCRGIAHHRGNLYITSGVALYNYTVDGKLVRKLYENTSGHVHAVGPCAVSPDGDRLYFVDHARSELITLAINGTILSRLNGLKMDASIPPGLHVTDSGKVLLSVVNKGTILEVDRDGRQILADVVGKNDGLDRPASIYFRKLQHVLIVGMTQSTVHRDFFYPGMSPGQRGRGSGRGLARGSARGSGRESERRSLLEGVGVEGVCALLRVDF